MNKRVVFANGQGPDRLSMAACVLLATYSVTSGALVVTSLVAFHWADLAVTVAGASASRGIGSAAPLGIAVLGIVEVHLLALALGMVLPLATAVGVMRHRRWALPAAFGLIPVGIGLALLFSWLAILLVFIAATAALLLVCVRSKRAVVTTEADRTERIGISYMLLVGAGMFGAHDFYTKRAWAGVLHLLLVLLGFMNWGTILGDVAIGGLLLMTVFDVVLLPRRVEASFSQSS